MEVSFRCRGCGGGRSRPLFEKDGLAFHRCGLCGLVQQHPMPDAAAISAMYADNPHYGEELDRNEEVFLGRDRAVLERLVARFGANGPLLDVGAGAGLLLRAALERGWDAVGLEPSRPSAERIRAALGAVVHEEPLERAPLAEASFGVVTLSHSLEHLPEPRAALERIGRLLRPGGLVHVAVPNWRCWKRLAAGRHVPWIYAHHLVYFERRTLEGLLEATGFRVLEAVHGTYPGPDYPFVLALLRRLGLEEPLRRWLRLGERPLESLIGDDVRVECPPWRFRALLRFAHLVLRLWPDALSRRLGGADELRLTARRAAR